MIENSKNENSSKHSRRWHKATIYLSITAIMLLAGGSYAYLGLTMVEPWKPIVVAAVIGLIPPAIVATRRRTSLAGLLKLLYIWVMTTAVSLFVLLCLNYHCGPSSSEHTETITIERKYRETRYRTQRVRKNVSRRGEPYSVYFIDARFDNGRVKTFGVTLSRYNSIKTGATLKLDMRQGLLGLPVITTRNI